MKKRILSILRPLYPLWTLIVSMKMWGKCRLRKMEFEHHIRMIHDPAGSSKAEYHYDQCVHISEHYRISLGEARFASQGGFADLWEDVKESERRANDREKLTNLGQRVILSHVTKNYHS